MNITARRVVETLLDEAPFREFTIEFPTVAFPRGAEVNVDLIKQRQSKVWTKFNASCPGSVELFDEHARAIESAKNGVDYLIKGKVRGPLDQIKVLAKAGNTGSGEISWWVNGGDDSLLQPT